MSDTSTLERVEFDFELTIACESKRGCIREASKCTVETCPTCGRMETLLCNGHAGIMEYYFSSLVYPQLMQCAHCGIQWTAQSMDECFEVAPL